jgi:hypothetical protein
MILKFINFVPDEKMGHPPVERSPTISEILNKS